MIAVPAPHAQPVVDQVVAAGIKAILNFSPGALKVPPDVKLKSVDLTVSLESLSFYLAQGEAAMAKRAAPAGAGCRTSTRSGKARMVDVGDKPVTEREALAPRRDHDERRRRCALIRTRRGRQGRPAADGAAGRHHGGQADGGADPAVSSAAADATSSVELTPTRRGYRIEARVRTTAQTGVEMEALTAVSVAALTIYDMVKAVDKAMVIGDICLVEKRAARAATIGARPMTSAHCQRHAPHGRGTTYRLAVILGALTAMGPLAIDMYLPALPAIARELRRRRRVGPGQPGRLLHRHRARPGVLRAALGSLGPQAGALLRPGAVHRCRRSACALTAQRRRR